MQTGITLGYAAVCALVALLIGGQYFVMFKHCRLFQYKFCWWEWVPLGLYVGMVVYIAGQMVKFEPDKLYGKRYKVKQVKDHKEFAEAYNAYKVGREKSE